MAIGESTPTENFWEMHPPLRFAPGFYQSAIRTVMQQVFYSNINKYKNTVTIKQVKNLQFHIKLPFNTI